MCHFPHSLCSVVSNLQLKIGNVGTFSPWYREPLRTPPAENQLWVINSVPTRASSENVGSKVNFYLGGFTSCPWALSYSRYCHSPAQVSCPSKYWVNPPQLVTFLPLGWLCLLSITEGSLASWASALVCYQHISDQWRELAPTVQVWETQSRPATSLYLAIHAAL